MLYRTLVLFLVGLVGMIAACGTLGEAKAPATLSLLDCTAKALVPLTGTYERAVEVVRDAKAKRVSIPEFLSAAHATQAELETLDAELRACLAAYPVAPADAGAP
jgi:hypothetical protein